MSEENNTEVENQEDFQEFFENYYPEIEATSSQTDDKKSKAEQDSLFNGGFSNIDVWLKH